MTVAPVNVNRFQGKERCDPAALAATLRAYARDRQARLLLHLAGFVILLLLLVGLGRRSRYGDEDDEALAGYSQILAPPASSALLVALLASLAIHPEAPTVAHELVALIAVLPLLRLLPRLIHSSLRKAEIEIPFPQRDVHVKSIDDSVKKETRLSEGERERQ
jgi:hypothetical protein